MSDAKRFMTREEADALAACLRLTVGCEARAAESQYHGEGWTVSINDQYGSRTWFSRMEYQTEGAFKYDSRRTTRLAPAAPPKDDQ